MSQPRTPGGKFAPVDSKQLVALFEAGFGWREAAGLAGVSVATGYRRWRAWRGRTRFYRADLHAEAIKLRAEGWTYAQIGARFGWSKQRARWACVESRAARAAEEADGAA